MDLEDNPLNEEEFIDEDIENSFIDQQQIELDASKLSQNNTKVAQVEDSKA